MKILGPLDGGDVGELQDETRPKACHLSWSPECVAVFLLRH